MCHNGRSCHTFRATGITADLENGAINGRPMHDEGRSLRHRALLVLNRGSSYENLPDHLRKTYQRQNVADMRQEKSPFSICVLS